MAFATSNIKLESSGSLWNLVGDFTASAGDADGSLSINGARIYQAYFYDQSDATPSQAVLPVKITEATSGTTSTITINVAGGVTRGRFIVVYR